jgi:hypothetical protein
MRNPDDLAAHSAAQPLGAPPVTSRVGALPADGPPRSAATQHEQQPELRPIRIATEPKPRPYPLRDNELVLSSGLIIHRVPKGISVTSAREQRTGDLVWEISDARGRRLALLKERSFRSASASSASVLDETTTLRQKAQRSDWGSNPVRVVVDRFRAEHHIYTLERRESGTAWIWSNLELTNGLPPERRDD